MTHDRFLERGRKNQGKGNDSCDILINIFFLIFYVNIQPCPIKEWIFQQKNQTDNYGNLVGKG